MSAMESVEPTCELFPVRHAHDVETDIFRERDRVEGSGQGHGGSAR
jgi:hypothetical protein